MSYDLFFPSPEGLDANGRFRSFFQGRKHYTLESDQAWYSNEDTGVYFSFELSGAQDDEVDAWAAFNMNFFRPHFFALEALPELRAFVDQLKVEVNDPLEKMGCVFSDDAFMSGWDEGNRLACRTFSAQELGTPVCRSTEELDRVWRWNLGRDALHDALGDKMFVPKISFFDTSDGPRTGCVWGDAIPIVLPDTQIVVLYKDSLAPRKWFRKQTQIALISRASLEPALTEFRRADDPVEHVFLDYTRPPATIREVFASSDSERHLSQMSVDDVLNAEYFEETA